MFQTELLFDFSCCCEQVRALYVPQLPGGKNGAPLMVFGENDSQVGCSTPGAAAAGSDGNAHACSTVLVPTASQHPPWICVLLACSRKRVLHSMQLLIKTNL